jgi:hypothetical protein
MEVIYLYMQGHAVALNYFYFNNCSRPSIHVVCYPVCFVPAPFLCTFCCCASTFITNNLIGLADQRCAPLSLLFNGYRVLSRE